MQRGSATVAATGRTRIACDMGDGVLISLEGDNFAGACSFKARIGLEDWVAIPYQGWPAASPTNSVTPLSTFPDDLPQRALVLPPFRELDLDITVVGGELEVFWAEVRLATRPA